MTFLSSLFLFLSSLFLTNKKREKQGCHHSCHQLNVQISLLYPLITLSTLYKLESYYKRVFGYDVGRVNFDIVDCV